MQTASFSVQNELNGGCEMCVSPAEEITVTVRPRLSGGDCKLAACSLSLPLSAVCLVSSSFLLCFCLISSHIYSLCNKRDEN